eukprot:6214509-Pleurochrysis_carterae.AAC.10
MQSQQSTFIISLDIVNCTIHDSTKASGLRKSPAASLKRVSRAEALGQLVSPQTSSLPAGNSDCRSHGASDVIIIRRADYDGEISANVIPRTQEAQLKSALEAEGPYHLISSSTTSYQVL